MLLKWPNDILHAETKSKISGILVEAQHFSHLGTIYSVGCGVTLKNVNKFAGIVDLLNKQQAGVVDAREMRQSILVNLLLRTSEFLHSSFTCNSFNLNQGST